MLYVTRDGQTIFDIALKTCGLENVYAYIKSNPEITDINFSFDNKNLTTEFIQPPSATPPELMANAAVVVAAKLIIGREGQSLFDICLMATNDLGGLMQFIRDNNISNLNQASLIGKSFTFEIDNIKDAFVYNYLTNSRAVFNTGIIIYQSALLQEDGDYLLQENGGLILV